MSLSYKNTFSMKKSFLILSIVSMALLSFSGLAFDKTQKRKKLSETTRASLIKTLEANETLHDAFFKYEGKTVETMAIQLKKAIDAISDKDISKLLNYSKTKLTEIKANNEREINNQNYHLVSMALIHIVNKYDVGGKYNAYSCPMVKKKWIQNSKKKNKVHNPYAPNMAHCGSKTSNY
jgi:hypothetical protein